MDFGGFGRASWAGKPSQDRDDDGHDEDDDDGDGDDDDDGNDDGDFDGSAFFEQLVLGAGVCLPLRKGLP